MDRKRERHHIAFMPRNAVPATARPPSERKRRSHSASVDASWLSLALPSGPQRRCGETATARPPSEGKRRSHSASVDAFWLSLASPLALNVGADLSGEVLVQAGTSCLSAAGRHAQSISGAFASAGESLSAIRVGLAASGTMIWLSRGEHHAAASHLPNASPRTVTPGFAVRAGGAGRRTVAVSCLPIVEFQTKGRTRTVSVDDATLAESNGIVADC
jgi:hypothetical protein